MTEPESGEEATLFPKTAGDKLREARLAQNLTLADVAARTRVPTRHLEAIESADYSGLPSPTYSVGFAKAYARAVGLDEVVIGREVRQNTQNSPRTPDYEPYDIADPARLPPRGLATVLGIVAALLVAGVAIWYGYGAGWMQSKSTPEPAPVAAAPVTPPPPTPAPTPAATNGQVVLTATDVVWLRVYDGGGKTLFEGQLNPGDHYDVPADANRPMINVGRPDKLQITVNGSSVPPLGDGARAIKDVELTAASLIARSQAAPAAPGGTAAPVAPGAVANPATGTDSEVHRTHSPPKSRAARPTIDPDALRPVAEPAPASNGAAPISTPGAGPTRELLLS